MKINDRIFSNRNKNDNLGFEVGLEFAFLARRVTVRDGFKSRVQNQRGTKILT
jgi:hypothetical protein